jgi:hypothetical protein
MAKACGAFGTKILVPVCDQNFSLQKENDVDAFGSFSSL